ncbi:MAG: hypothetical protein AAF840_06875 [Bacteroidota bacterium]
MIIKLVYIANIIVAGWVGITSLFFPRQALHSIFENTVAFSEAIRMAGALWSAIFLLSIVGLWYPQRMSVVLLLQVIYKGSWLLVVALPAILNSQPYPKGMAGFFLVWVICLPLVIPWSYLFGGATF